MSRDDLIGSPTYMQRSPAERVAFLEHVAEQFTRNWRPARAGVSHEVWDACRVAMLAIVDDDVSHQDYRELDQALCARLDELEDAERFAADALLAIFGNTALEMPRTAAPATSSPGRSLPSTSDFTDEPGLDRRLHRPPVEPQVPTHDVGGRGGLLHVWLLATTTTPEATFASVVYLGDVLELDGLDRGLADRLVTMGWLDVDASGRVLVHDWDDHQYAASKAIVQAWERDRLRGWRRRRREADDRTDDGRTEKPPKPPVDDMTGQDITRHDMTRFRTPYVHVRTPNETDDGNLFFEEGKRRRGTAPGPGTTSTRRRGARSGKRGGRGLQVASDEEQRSALWPLVDARPNDAARLGPRGTSGRATSFEVVADVLTRWKRLLEQLPVIRMGRCGTRRAYASQKPGSQTRIDVCERRLAVPHLPVVWRRVAGVRVRVRGHLPGRLEPERVGARQARLPPLRLPGPHRRVHRDPRHCTPGTWPRPPSGRPRTPPVLGSARWRKLRLETIARQRFRCARCGAFGGATPVEPRAPPLALQDPRRRDGRGRRGAVQGLPLGRRHRAGGGRPRWIILGALLRAARWLGGEGGHGPGLRRHRARSSSLWLERRGEAVADHDATPAQADPADVERRHRAALAAMHARLDALFSAGMANLDLRERALDCGDRAHLPLWFGTWAGELRCRTCSPLMRPGEGFERRDGGIVDRPFVRIGAAGAVDRTRTAARTPSP